MTLNPMSPRRKSRARLYAAARRAVHDRSNGVCEVCREWAGDQAHHRLRRSQGGSDTPENLLWVCTVCHNRIHAFPAWAYEMGYLLRGVS